MLETDKERLTAEWGNNMAKYTVGKEPENIKRRLKTLFNNLDTAYPNKVIVSTPEPYMY